jgi:hypothetical protein
MPDVRAKVYRPNLQAKALCNRKFCKRNYRIYVKRCNKCSRPNYWSYLNLPGYCLICGIYLTELEGRDIWIDDLMDNDVLISDVITGYSEEIPF